ncbi:MAG: FHA domain-containing protein [Planctomycetes bacterium]|nr:FHA domain-containing protein [Planctomycetota bacterium]
MADLAFRITQPGKPVAEVPIAVGVSIGRRPENSIVLEDGKASGRHAHVVQKEGQLVIEDLGSSNHTHILGGSTLQGGESHPLTLGTAFQIGETKFVVVAAAGADGGGDDRTIAAQMLSPSAGAGGAAGGLAVLAAFKAARPRIVLANEAIRAIHDMDKIQFVIGRKGDATNLAIEHQAVSACHATISFEDRRFYIEDMGSSNGTFLGGDRLPANQRVELKPETQLRFGSIDALFVIDSSAEGQAADERRYRNAIEVLVAEGDLPASQRDEVVREAKTENRHPGEILLRRGLISVDAWIKAWRKAEFHVARGAGESSGGGGSSRYLMAIIALLLLVVLLLALKQFDIIQF